MIYEFESNVFGCDVCGKRTLQDDGVFSGIGRFCSDKCCEEKEIQLNTHSTDSENEGNSLPYDGEGYSEGQIDCEMQRKKEDDKNG